MICINSWHFMVLVENFHLREILGAQKMKKKMQEKMAFLQLLSFVIQITLKIKTEA